MTLAFGTYSTTQDNVTLVPAEAGRIIRVLEVAITTWTDVKVTLLSDPGPSPTQLTPALHACRGGPVVLRPGRRLALATARGRALGLSAFFRSTADEFSVAVWYEVVR